MRNSIQEVCRNGCKPTFSQSPSIDHSFPDVSTAIPSPAAMAVRTTIATVHALSFGFMLAITSSYPGSRFRINARD